MVSLFCFSHLIGQLAEAHIVSWFELGRVQLDLLSQLDQAWRGSQTALQSHLFQYVKVVRRKCSRKNAGMCVYRFGGWRWCWKDFPLLCSNSSEVVLFHIVMFLEHLIISAFQKPFQCTI